MKKIIFKDRYPVYTTEILKSETRFNTTDEIIGYLKEKIKQHPIASHITVFDHYSHTKSLSEHKIMEGMIDAKNIIFCFGKEIPTPQILAVRPRSIGICEFANKFEINFLEAPKEGLQKELESWIEELFN